MGNTMKRSKGNNKVSPQQGGSYPPNYGQPGQYRPPMPMQQQAPYRYGPPVMPVQQQVRPAYTSQYEDMQLSSITGFSPADLQRLRVEFYNYANAYGVIDRQGFQKLYVASLLNKPWQTIGHDAELAFRNFDANSTGMIDFNEYITACSRLSGGTYRPSNNEY